MKTKKILNRLCFICLFVIVIAPIAPAQLYVKSNGYVGVGTTSPWYTFHVAGKGYFREGNYVIRIFPDNGGTEIGTSTDKLTFWYSNTGYNKLYAEKFVKVSDSTLKENIQPLNNGLTKVLEMLPKSYNLSQDEDSLKRKEYGFLAQEMENLLPELVSEGKDVKLLDYDQIIPFLVSAIQELHAAIEDLQANQKGEVDPLSLNGSGTSYLEQNSPNPFTETTFIRYSVAQGASKASVMIFNLQGTLLRTYPILQTGIGEVVIEGKDLKAGMYIYSLVVDEVEVDSRKMILSR